MNYQDFILVIKNLVNNGLVLPYGVLPGSMLGGDKNVAIDEGTWNSYEWNPPQYLKGHKDYENADTNASDKPTWQQITNIDALKIPYLKKLNTKNVNIEARRRIAVNYHPQAGRDRNKEWETRLSGLDLATKDTERVRLIAVCHALEVSINTATTTAQLDAIDITSDSVWSADDD